MELSDTPAHNSDSGLQWPRLHLHLHLPISLSCNLWTTNSRNFIRLLFWPHSIDRQWRGGGWGVGEELADKTATKKQMAGKESPATESQDVCSSMWENGLPVTVCLVSAEGGRLVENVRPSTVVWFVCLWICKRLRCLSKTSGHDMR